MKKELKKMLDSVLSNNRDRKGINEILAAMEKVDRKFFVKTDEPYVDTPIFIGYGQTISQPTTVARMISLLDLKKGIKALEIGSGSGWNATLVAFLVKPGKVVSVERIKELSDMATENYDSVKGKLNLNNAEFVFANALDKKGKIWKEKYDRIITTAAASLDFREDLIFMGKTLLNENGLILFPTEGGDMELYQMKEKKLIKIYSEYGFSFVPLLKGTE